MGARPEVGVRELRMEERTVQADSVVTKVMPGTLEPAHVARAKPALESAMKAASQGRCGQKGKAGDQSERKRRKDAFHLRSPSKEACLCLVFTRSIGKVSEHLGTGAGVVLTITRCPLFGKKRSIRQSPLRRGCPTGGVAALQYLIRNVLLPRSCSPAAEVQGNPRTGDARGRPPSWRARGTIGDTGDCGVAPLRCLGGALVGKCADVPCEHRPEIWRLTDPRSCSSMVAHWKGSPSLEERSPAFRKISRGRGDEGDSAEV
jgi:hypothetical protein